MCWRVSSHLKLWDEIIVGGRRPRAGCDRRPAPASATTGGQGPAKLRRKRCARTRPFGVVSYAAGHPRRLKLQKHVLGSRRRGPERTQGHLISQPTTRTRRRGGAGVTGPPRGGGPPAGAVWGGVQGGGALLRCVRER